MLLIGPARGEDARYVARGHLKGALIRTSFSEPCKHGPAVIQEAQHHHHHIECPSRALTLGSEDPVIPGLGPRPHATPTATRRRGYAPLGVHD